MIRFLIRFSGLLFIAFALGALVFFASIESVFNGGFAESIKILCLPFGVAILAFMYFNREALADSSLGLWQSWLLAAIVYPLSLLFGWPYLMAVNTLAFNPAPIIYSGPVIAKFVSSGKSTSHHIRLRDVSSGEIVELLSPRDAYSRIQVGAMYCTAFHRGLFGIPFRWRFASSSALETACASRQAATSVSS
ncbi:hypothetical protein PMI15_02079 [Polaromonas sp. CF318]|uniref:hypothetical protein n=1 Tax=Polaromonas sp. CF318 TaxID=1144318 RepID=UPI000271179E|nr:hypothetical protein [Polaromonas sp. CF318]EJL84600.1 hypothetical protein PMI15_02079 [Polaromonas sp. CF318]